MNEVLLNLRAPVASEVATDCARRSRCRVSRSRERAESFNHSVSCNTNGDDRSTLHELDEGFEKRLAFVLGIVSVQERPFGLNHAEVNNDVSLCFDSAKHLAGQIAGDAIRLDEDEGFFDVSSHEADSFRCESSLMPV